MENWLGTVGYVLSAAAYLFAFILLVFTQTNSKTRILLAITFALGALWSASFALQSYYEVFSLHVFGIETLKNAFWMAILINILGNDEPLIRAIVGSKNRLLVSALLLLCLTIETVFGSITKNHEILLTLHLGQAILILCLVEQLYRRTEKIHRWKVKPLCLGLGLIYTYDLAFFSDALLIQRVNENFLYGRGWVSLLSVPLILLTVRRIKQWSIRIYISRDILFHSTLLVVSGGYLLAMAFTGYLIKYLGYSWSNVAQYVFLALSCTVLVSLFLSESLRSQLRVFLVKHFYENKYDYRDEWMNFSATLEHQDQSAYHVALVSMMKPFSCEKGILFELKNNRLIERAKINIAEHDYHERLGNLSKKAMEQQWIIDLDDLKSESKTLPFDFDAEEIKGENKIKYIVPMAEAGNFDFVFMLSKINSTNKLDFEDRDLMRVIGKQLSVFINLHITSTQLAESQQFSAFNQMSTFLVHDLKNVLAQLELLSKNAKKHRNNPEFIDDVFVTIESASARLNKVLSHLRKRSLQEHGLEKTNLTEVIVEACHDRMHNSPPPICDIKRDDEVFLEVDKERIKNVFLHLIQNSQDATEANGSVTVSRVDKEGFFVVRIEDDGIGMSESFISNRLFKPFDTTKGNAGMGIGAYDAKKFIEQLNGYIEVTSSEGVGSRFEVYIPTEQ
ncbi:XrtA/PEP-CTERM system histidine kinase PrsK (plasmid) [Vibrio alfacsensis]|uniref:XrtA/PEP-CTERM system histidine kinase PrsK n=1 Tax=Vibrio alfacsensis TaxID=1074311 RepID=UPI002ADE4784|nr:XrtA/PEP-CTERM system histidine kinase PrsK [Vibrio alfacsensis]WQE79159.1 XrtA/PEP-CTERM system histidine kinase PrsK [Vibrio alfacsensis]